MESVRINEYLKMYNCLDLKELKLLPKEALVYHLPKEKHTFLAYVEPHFCRLAEFRKVKMF